CPGGGRGSGSAPPPHGPGPISPPAIAPRSHSRRPPPPAGVAPGSLRPHVVPLEGARVGRACGPCLPAAARLPCPLPGKPGWEREHGAAQGEPPVRIRGFPLLPEIRASGGGEAASVALQPCAPRGRRARASIFHPPRRKIGRAHV